MKYLKLLLVIIIFTNLTFPNQIKAENKLNFYINDFYFKSNEARQILKGIENSLKEGSKDKICLKQIKAAELGLNANDSLIKAFEIKGIEPPFEAINASKKKWESLLNKCKKR